MSKRPNQPLTPLHSNHGFFVVHITTFMLTLIGIWFLWHSYTKGEMKQDIQTIYNDYSEVMQKYIPGKK